MRYWVRSEGHGVLGGIGFGSATWQLRARDDWIGWSADARAANLGRVLCNHRFLLLPGVRVYGLASRVLCMATQRVADDWESRYLLRPLAAYTHVDAEHSGYCYHRAGWTVAGRTSGRRGEAGARPGRCGRRRWRRAGGRRCAMWAGARWARWRAPSTARRWTGRRGSTAARATPTGGCATGSSGWAGPGRSRRWRQGQQGHPDPCRAGGDVGGPAAGPVHDGRGLPGGSRVGQPPLAAGARAGAAAHGGPARPRG